MLEREVIPSAPWNPGDPEGKEAGIAPYFIGKTFAGINFRAISRIFLAFPKVYNRKILFLRSLAKYW